MGWSSRLAGAWRGVPGWNALWRVGAVAALAGAMFAGTGPASGPAPSPPAAGARIVSLDYCADQYVLGLAPRDRIAALSPHAQAPFSFLRAQARGLPQTRASLEGALAFKPDVVVRSYGGGPMIAARLERLGVRVVQLGYAEDFEGVRANVRLAAKALDAAPRGEALIAAMDARLAAAAAAGGGRTALYVTPGGATTGPGSLVHEIFVAAGFTNFETAPGWREIPLERLAREAPALFAASFYDIRVESEGGWSAARHPILTQRLEAGPSVALASAWTACGGWFAAEAATALARAGAGQ